MAGKLCLKILSGCAILTIIGVCSAFFSSADTLSDYEKRQKELDQKAQEYQRLINSTASDIAQKEEYQTALQNKITVLNEQIITGREQINTLDTEIEELRIEIDASREKISGNIETLKQRLKTIYLTGETTSIEIILGAKTFDEFLDGVELVSYMSDHDQKLIDKLRNEVDVINKKRDALNEKKTALSEEQKNITKRQTEMQRLLTENEKLLKSLYKENSGAQDHLDETNAEMKKVDDMIKAYYADKAAQAKNAKAASEAVAKIAESKAAAGTSSAASRNGTNTVVSTTRSKYVTSSQRPVQPDTTSSNTTTSHFEYTSSEEDPVESDISSSEPVVSYYSEPEPEPDSDPDPVIPDPPTSTGYEWPVPGHYILSSEWNEDRTTYNHGAIDISDASIMNAEVVAAESGIVVLSNDDCEHNYGKDGSCGCGGGYGNYIMIDHGNGKATLYGHLTSLTVSSGDYVQKGQLIGYVGTTGWSTGPHLHYETRLNGEKYNPMTEYPNL